jgi:ATP-dependent DNA helicase
MMAKMEAQQAAMRNKEQEQDKKRESQQEGKVNNVATTQQRKSARTNAATEANTPEPGKDPLRPTSRKATRSAGKKKDGFRISDYFKKDDLKAKAGKESIAEVLEEVAIEQEHNPKALGAQVLRSARQPALVAGGVMRNYQLEGLDWLCSLYENGLNGILADEMGLGKTIQTIAFLAFLREKGTMGPFLIAGPLSTLSNWVDEFERFAPGIPVVLYHGTPPQRAEIRHKRLGNESASNFPVVCTTYEICMNDRKYLADYNWKFIIIVGSPDVQLDITAKTKVAQTGRRPSY